MKKLLLIPVISFTLLYAAHSQTPESVLETVQQKYTSEKIYFHYDKTNYIAGETIWFKAYLMKGFAPSVESTVLAVELLNDSGRLLDKKILPISGSAAIGEFSLPKTLPQGAYIIKAYTKNLTNFGFDSYYYHTLNIYNPTSANILHNQQASYQLSFLPESGNMVAGIKNRVAFKCTDNYGNPKSVKGIIKNETGKEIISFTSDYDGMGIIEIIPQANEKYMADCVIEGNNPKIQSLPLVANAGVVLQITRQDAKTSFLLDATTVTHKNLEPAYILGVMENIIAFKILIADGIKHMTGEIPVSQLPSGILQLTVFNQENKPLAERLVFVNSGDFMAEGTFKSEKISVKPRTKNTFVFTLADTMPGTFSVSVTDGAVENNPADNIISRFLLTADMKGLIHNPSYYFESDDLLHQQRLDYVMLTNGWRRYSWNEMFSGHFPPMTFKDPGYIAISGKAFNPKKDKPLVNQEVTAIVKTKDKQTDFYKITTDSAGNFFANGFIFEDTARFYLQSTVTKNSKVNLTLTSHYLSQLFHSLQTPLPKTFLAIPGDELQKKFEERYNVNKLSRFDGILLDEIKIKSKIKSEKEKYEEKYVSGRMGSATKELDFINDPPRSHQNILSYLQGRLNGVNITGGPLNYSIVYRNTRSLLGGPIQMSVYLDEFQVEPSQIATLPVSDVAMVKVYGGSGYTGGAGGALVIYTIRGEGSLRNGGIDLTAFDIEGFSPTKEFFSPNYEKYEETTILHDERSTLYWNPYIITHAGHKDIQVSFYNSDKAKKYKIIIEGFLETGKLLHIEKMLE